MNTLNEPGFSMIDYLFPDGMDVFQDDSRVHLAQILKG